ncbi:MAG: hypothetical protein P4L74_03885 [Candidatus Doudnabacteria bacterium]|nr:hypothetical protein [Candidatus Doudnabacteria bacterium]
MDNNQAGIQHGQNCQCGSCQPGMMHHGCCCGHGHHRFFVLRWVLGLLILAIVFAIGLKIGEFKGEINGGYYGNYGGGYGQMHRMMPYYYNYGVQPQMYQSWGASGAAGSVPMMVPQTTTQAPTK